MCIHGGSSPLAQPFLKQEGNEHKEAAMQFTTHNQLSPKNHAHHGRRATNLCAWVRSPTFGYVAGIFLVGALLLIEKVDEYLPQAPLLTVTPFALVSIL